MAILALATSLADLRERLGRMVIYLKILSAYLLVTFYTHGPLLSFNFLSTFWPYPFHLLASSLVDLRNGIRQRVRADLSLRCGEAWTELWCSWLLFVPPLALRCGEGWSLSYRILEKVDRSLH